MVQTSKVNEENNGIVKDQSNYSWFFFSSKKLGDSGGNHFGSLFVLQLLDNIQYFSSKVLYNDIVKNQCSYSHQFSLVKLETTICFVLTNLFIMLPQKYFLRHHFNSLSLNHPPPQGPPYYSLRPII